MPTFRLGTGHTHNHNHNHTPTHTHTHTHNLTFFNLSFSFLFTATVWLALCAWLLFVYCFLIFLVTRNFQLKREPQKGKGQQKGRKYIERKRWKRGLLPPSKDRHCSFYLRLNFAIYFISCSNFIPMPFFLSHFLVHCNLAGSFPSISFFQVFPGLSSPAPSYKFQPLKALGGVKGVMINRLSRLMLLILNNEKFRNRWQTSGVARRIMAKELVT